jgi:predicted O-methyltransferase YrrM
MLGDGLLPELAPPLRVLLGEPPPAEVAAVSELIERRRAEMASSPERYAYAAQATPLGGARWADGPPDAAGGEATSVRRLATAVSVNARAGMFLHLCARSVEARTVIELGAAVGISGAYLASAPSVERLVSIEGSPPLARLAAETIRTVSDAATIHAGDFEAELPTVVETLAGERRPVDLAYIDGHHTEAPTVHYATILAPHLRQGSLVVLDDIRLWQGMRSAWRRLASAPGVAASVDAGRFGILVWGGAPGGSPRHYDLARYTGWPHRAVRRERPRAGL